MDKNTQRPLPEEKLYSLFSVGFILNTVEDGASETIKTTCYAVFWLIKKTLNSPAIIRPEKKDGYVFNIQTVLTVTP